MQIVNELENLPEEELLARMDRERLPRHIAIIMGGNGRWAKSRGFGRVRGHRAGIKSVRNAINESRRLGIEFLTLYAFSSENWKRPRKEVNALMKLLKEYLVGERQELMEKGIRFRTIGRRDVLPDFVSGELDDTVSLTENNRDMTLTLALSYGGRAEIVDAVNDIIASGVDTVDEAAISENLYAPDHPDPDLLIRTSGESRVSNFLLWEIAYTEIYITETLWPDFGPQHLFAAIVDYQNRERRFGEVTRTTGGRE
ncbi:MAG: di-trans,poly-cis-decaprenylcistransferase [bacterium]|nr:di-trans,poly-cis-decaprenylcistransferase [bacterium]